MSKGKFEKISGYTGVYVRGDAQGGETFYVTKNRSGMVRIGTREDGFTALIASQHRDQIVPNNSPATEKFTDLTTLAQLFKQYLDHTKRVSLTTAHVDDVIYRNHIEEPLSSEPLQRLTRPRIEYFLGTLTETSPKTKRRILETLRRGYDYYIALGHNFLNPTKGIRIKVQSFRKDRILSREEINQMYAWCDRKLREKPSYWYDILELKAQITMGVEMGLRRSELWTDPGARERFGTDRSLFWKDIDFERNRVRLTRKGNSIHVMQLTPNVLKTLGHLRKRSLHEGGDNGGRVFRMLHLSKFTQILEDLGLNKGLTYDIPGDRERWVSFHTLRHTFGSIVLDQTKDLLVVSKLMNHSYQQTTLLYSHLLNNREDEAMNLIGNYFK